MKITNVFVGTVGQDPRQGSFEDGRAWANLRIAVNHDYFNGATGEVVNRGVSWFDVSAYGALARNVCFSIRKGDSIIVVGELRLRDWEKEGRTGTSGTIIADVVGPNLLFGVAKYTRSSSLNPDAPAGEAGDGEGDRARRRNGGEGDAWGLGPSQSSATAQSGSAAPTPPATGVSPVPRTASMSGDEPLEPAMAGAPAEGDADSDDSDPTTPDDGPPF